MPVLKRLLVCFLLCCPSVVLADAIDGYYFIKGTIANSHGELLINKRFLVKRGQLITSVKTDGHGHFLARLNFLFPCLSGENRARYDSQDIAAANSINGNNIEFFYENEIAQLASLWQPYYYQGIDTINKKNLHEFHIVLKAEQRGSHAEFVKFQEKANAWRNKIRMLSEQLDNRQLNAPEMNSFRALNAADFDILRELGVYIFYLENNFDLHNESVRDLHLVFGCPKKWFLLNHRDDQHYALAYPCYIERPELVNGIKLQTDQTGLISDFDEVTGVAECNAAIWTLLGSQPLQAGFHIDASPQHRAK
jgi:hypothetical protein